MSCIDPKIPFFFNYRTVFPVQKVSFIAAKIPMGRKSFLSLSARKKRKRYRRKKCPIIKKIAFLDKRGAFWTKTSGFGTKMSGFRTKRGLFGQKSHFRTR